MTMTWPSVRPNGHEPPASNPPSAAGGASPLPVGLRKGWTTSFDMVFGSKTVGGHSVHGEPNEPVGALSGVGGHSVHGLEGSEGNAHRSMVVGQTWVADRGDERNVLKNTR